MINSYLNSNSVTMNPQNMNIDTELVSYIRCLLLKTYQSSVNLIRNSDFIQCSLKLYLEVPGLIFLSNCKYKHYISGHPLKLIYFWSKKCKKKVLNHKEMLNLFTTARDTELY